MYLLFGDMFWYVLIFVFLYNVVLAVCQMAFAVDCACYIRALILPQLSSAIVKITDILTSFEHQEEYFLHVERHYCHLGKSHNCYR